MYIDLGAYNGNSFPPMGAVSFRSAKPWHWHTWQESNWPRKAFLFEPNSFWAKELRQKETSWNNGSIYGRVKVFTETMIGTKDGTGMMIEGSCGQGGCGNSARDDKFHDRGNTRVEKTMVNLMRLLVEETIKDDYVVLKIDTEGSEYDLIPCLMQSPAFHLIDGFYYEDHRGMITPSEQFTKETKAFDEACRLLRERGGDVRNLNLDEATQPILDLNPDGYAACPHDNKLFGRKEISMQAAMNLSDKMGHDARRSWNAVPTPIAGYSLAPWGPPIVHPNLRSAAQPKGRLAIATALATLGSVRNDVKNGAAADVFRCSVLLQYLSLKEFGGFTFSEDDNVDYVIVHANLNDEDVAFWRKFGIKTVKKDPFDSRMYHDPFRAGAMTRVHVAGLTEYSRVLSLDGDMYARTNIQDAFLREYAEDMLTDYNPSSPITGNFILVRPSEAAYDLFLHLSKNYKFNYTRGWNPQDPRSGLFVWPDAKEMPCDWKGGYLKNAPCGVTDEWVTRCEKKGATNWIWMGAAEVQGIFAYVYNISGVGTARWVDHADTSQVNQGNPWWYHFQGGCKPHLVVGLTTDGIKAECSIEALRWFWDELWTKTRVKYNLANECPSFEEASKGFSRKVGPR